jgi:hypothetical protein
VNGGRKPQRNSLVLSNGVSPLVPGAAIRATAPRRSVVLGGSGRRADRLTIAGDGVDIEIELAVGGRALVAGVVQTALSVGGESLDTRGDWQTVCRHADDDGDYLELQLCLSEAVRIDRQVLVSRREQFAFLADAVVVKQNGPVVPQAGTIEHRLGLLPADRIMLKFDATTREARLQTKGCTARVFPLALPQDRVRSTAGNFCEQGGRLTLTQVGAGRGLFAPLMFDWHPHRRRAKAEWRSLTVTESGKVVAPECASAHRLRLGKRHVLVYRSLAATDEARALLGHHTRYETVVGTFETSGNVAPIVMVELE